MINIFQKKMTSFQKKFIIFTSLLYLWIISHTPALFLAFAAHDEQLYVRLAQNIIVGDWLGKYDSFTLLKGPFYSIWIALCFYLGVPLFIGQAILHIGVGLLLFRSIITYIKNHWILNVFFIFYLFNPIQFSRGNLRIVRDNFYASLCVFVFALLLWIFHERERLLRYRLFSSILLGIVVACFWTTRDEGIWILPVFVFFILFFFLFKLYISPKKTDSIRKEILIIVLSFTTSFACIGIMSYINYRYYNYFGIIELRQKEFLSAFGALTRIHQENLKPHVPVPKESLSQAFKVSPTFRQIQHLIEGPNSIGEYWAYSDCVDYHIEPCDFELRPKFVFALRDSMSALGYYRSTDTAREFLGRVANEINHACENGIIKCDPIRKTMIPPFRLYYLETLVSEFWKGIKISITFGNSSHVYRFNSDGNPTDIFMFRDVVKTTYAPTLNEKKFFPATNRIMKRIFNFHIILFDLYEFIMPFISIFSFLIYVCFIILNILSKFIIKSKIGINFLNQQYPKIFIVVNYFITENNTIILFYASLSLVFIISRLFLLAFLSAVAMPGPFNSLYMAPIFPLILFFCCLIISFFCDLVSYYFTKVHNKKVTEVLNQ